MVKPTKVPTNEPTALAPSNVPSDFPTASDLEIFYSVATTNNNYENQRYSNNPMDSFNRPI